MPAIKYANVMFLGRTKAGKSSFINYLVNEDIQKTGDGMPITPNFETIIYDSMDGLPLCIYDSKGLEAEDYQDIRENIIKFIRDKCGSDDIGQWIHSIFYCVSMRAGRVLPQEIDLIKQLRSGVARSVHIILTNCSQTEEGREASERMTRHIREKLQDEDIRIYYVNSVYEETWKETMKPFGREAVLDKIFELLWSDISHQVAKKYAKELHDGLMRICGIVDSELMKLVKKISPIKIVMAAIKDDFERMEREMDWQLEWAEAETDKIIERLNESYQQRIDILVEFCQDYGKSFGRSIEFYDIDDFLPDDVFDFDGDELLKQTKLGRIMDEIDAFDEEFDEDSMSFADFLALLKMLFKSIGAIINMQQLCREVCEDFVVDLKQRIPETKNIEVRIYHKLMEGFQT